MPFWKSRKSSVTPSVHGSNEHLRRQISPDPAEAATPPLEVTPIITMEDLEMATRNSGNLDNGHHDSPANLRATELDVKDDAETLFFSDGRRRIDFVLVYQSGSRSIDRRRVLRRNNLEEYMKKEGLQFEIDTKPLTTHSIPGLDRIHDKLHEIPGMNRLHPHEAQENPHHGPESSCLCFMKIHATFDMLTKYADIMKLKMPLIKGNENLQGDELLRYFPNPFRVNLKLLPPLKEEFTSFFSEARIDQFHVTDEDTFFSPAQRSQIVWECLSRIRYDEGNPAKFGIQRLLANDTYIAAFPLHDGPLGRIIDEKPTNLRAILHDQWGRFGKWFKIQPIEYVKLYFGERVAFFFAWLEFYTAMLIPASLVGLGCFIYGAASLYRDIPTSEICHDPDVGNITMCPLCDKWCPFWKLRDSCALSKATYLFDNPATVFFSTFMAFWAMFFLELWQRRQSVVAWNFDTLDALEQYEPVRPELTTRTKDQRLNPVTNTLEPYVPRWKKWLHGLLSVSVISFMIFVVLAAVFGTVVYRMMVVVALYATSSTRQTFASQYATYITSITSAFLNLFVILILEKFYYKVAKWLTEMECPRSQTEYEQSLTWKYYIFEFVNCYSSLVYVGFFKGRVPAGYPGLKGWFNIPIDQCDQAGCIIELCIQLAVILLGKQLYSILREAAFPILSKWWSSQDIIKFFSRVRRFHRWEKDLQLRPFPPLYMFKEYTRMILQFGFITTFGAAFPLAPLFALLCNLFEIRFDAYKILVFYRRPVSQIAKNIGAWFRILQHLAQFAVVTNAFVISFTSEFVPKMVYLLAFSPTDTLHGYVEWSLSAYAVSDFPEDIAPLHYGDGFNSTRTCYYRASRNGPESPLKYSYNMTFWHILAARLALVLVLEHFILIITRLLAYLVPDLPSSLQAKLLRQNYLAKEAFYESESKRISQIRMQSQEDATQVTPSVTSTSLYPGITHPADIP